MALFSSSALPVPVHSPNSRSTVPPPPSFQIGGEISPVARRSSRLLCARRTRRRPERRIGAPRVSGSASEPQIGACGGKHRLLILVAGGGIGGLVFALAAKRKGFDVLVLEKDMSAIRGEGKHRGPIQIQSNALAALEAIDMEVADEVMRAGCITGNRVNGIVDGISGAWYAKFDTFTPAVERGIPVTRVICRMALQQILADAVGDDVILNGSNVVDFIDDGSKVSVILDNGKKYEGDLLVGADGIWSKVRELLFGPSKALYSGYTCYSGIADFVPPDLKTIGYRVYLGHKQYFVASDVGAGKIQWYAFHEELPGGIDAPNGKRERLLELFAGWYDNVIDLLAATDEDAILRRDIYDHIPIFKWGEGRVTLLGDSVHAMQPNMGQGGCMAIEDGYQLAHELDTAWARSVEAGTSMDISFSLKRYEEARRVRVAIIYGLSRMASVMASSYKPYLGVGLGRLSFRILHPGRVGGQFFFKLAMPSVLSWVLGGDSNKLEGRSLSCRLTDKASDQLKIWFEDDDALDCALNGEWYLFPIERDYDESLEPIHLNKDEQRPLLIGNPMKCESTGSFVSVPSSQVAPEHARITCNGNVFHLTDMKSEHGTWITDNEGRRHRLPPNVPIRLRPSEIIEFGSDKKARFRVKVLNAQPHKAGGGQRDGA